MSMPNSDIARISYCLCGDQVIFLDTERDRYFALRRRENDIFREQIALGIPCDALGPISLSEAEICRPIAAPKRDLATASPVSRANLLSVSLAAIAYAQWALSLRWRGLASTLSMGARSGQQVRHAIGKDRYRRIAASFRSLGSFGGTADNCLPRSLAFHALARRTGLAPSLVIGVKTAPFAAHCWAQDGDMVLNDTVERVRIFTPILVVG